MMTIEKSEVLITDAIRDFYGKMKGVQPNALMILGAYQATDGLELADLGVNAVAGEPDKLVDLLANGAQEVANNLEKREGKRAKYKFDQALVLRIAQRIFDDEKEA